VIRSVGVAIWPRLLLGEDWASGEPKVCPLLEGALGRALTLIAPIRPLQLCADGGYQLRLGVLGVPLIMVPDRNKAIYPRCSTTSYLDSKPTIVKIGPSLYRSQIGIYRVLSSFSEFVSHPDLRDKAECISYMRQRRQHI
jgi:hypothetical protein